MNPGIFPLIFSWYNSKGTLSNKRGASESIGTQISVDHTAPSPLGVEIVATATVAGIDGRKINFDNWLEITKMK